MSVIFCILLTNILTTRRFVFYECFSMKKITALSHFSCSRTIEGLLVTINKVGTAENQRYYCNNPHVSKRTASELEQLQIMAILYTEKTFFSLNFSLVHRDIVIKRAKHVCLFFGFFFSKLTGCQRNKVVKLYIGRLKNFPHRTLLSQLLVKWWNERQQG